MFVVLLVIVVAVFGLVFTYFKISFSYWEKRGVPFVKPRIPWGSGASLLDKNRISPGQYFKKLYLNGKKKGWKYFGFYTFSNSSFMITDLNLLKNIMSKDFNYFVDRGLYYNEKDDPLSAHLFALGGTRWKNLRKKLTPTFTSGKMKNMFTAVADCAQLLDKAMEIKAASNEPIDIKDILARFTTDVIGVCAFGLDCNSFGEEESPFREYGNKLFAFGGNIFKAIAIAISMTFPNFGRTLRLRLLPKDSSDFFFKIVKDTIEYRQANNIVKKDFLQLLMDLKDGDDDDYKGDGNSLTLKEIAAQCLVFFIAGFETSSTTMNFALFELSRNPDMQEKLRDEVNKVLEKYDGEITYEALNEMHYMDQVIDETLRLYPAVTMITRKCVQDYKIPGEDMVIEKGTKIIIPILGIHHDSEYYPNPEVFDPERFSPEVKKTREQYAHIPFGEGNRICIGLRFGLMQTKIGLATLLRNYEFQLNEKTQLPFVYKKFSIVLAVEGGVWLDCKKIN